MANESPSSIDGTGHSMLESFASSGQAFVRPQLAAQHLLAAAHLSRQISVLERDNPQRPSGTPFDELLGLSIGCILLSSASVEAYVNEIFADRKDHFTTHDQALLELLWVDYQQKTVIEEFELALRLRAQDSLDRGSSWVQSLDRLILLRNALTHFKPEWSHEPGHT